MNKPTHPVTSADSASPAYDDDAYGWAMAQARYLREQRFDAIDWENVAEEIESMGKSERRAVESALQKALLHQLKWRHQPNFRSRSWRNSIAEPLRRFEEELADNPSLAAKLDEILARAYRRARFEATQETGFAPETFPPDPPTWDEIRAPLTD